MQVSRILRLPWWTSSAMRDVTYAGKEFIQKRSVQYPMMARAITSTINRRMLSTVSMKPATENGPQDVTEGKLSLRAVEVTFRDNSTSHYPHLWLRENCQCDKCFNKGAIGREVLIDDLKLDIQPKDLQLDDGGVQVTWKDGHVSFYTNQWLHQRAFNSEARAKQRTLFALPKIYWGSDFKVPEMNFHLAVEDEMYLYEMLVMLEKYGVVLVKGGPAEAGRLTQFIERLGFVRKTHYGPIFEVKTQLVPHHISNTGAKLALHTDYTFMDYPPGTVWLHCVRQHTGSGGENDLSDGFHAAEILREKNPDLFDTLVRTPVYFQDKGFHSYAFDKITRSSTIQLDAKGDIERLTISFTSRDSFMDLDSNEVHQFYKALKAFKHILYDKSIRVKTGQGDIIVMDNTRVLHGRQAFDQKTAPTKGLRHIQNVCIDWDDLRSRRRVLQKNLGIQLN